MSRVRPPFPAPYVATPAPLGFSPFGLISSGAPLPRRAPPPHWETSRAATGAEDRRYEGSSRQGCSIAPRSWPCHPEQSEGFALLKGSGFGHQRERTGPRGGTRVIGARRINGASREIRPILPLCSVNHSAPSGPTAMAIGKLPTVGTVNSAMMPSEAIRPILLPLA